MPLDCLTGPYLANPERIAAEVAAQVLAPPPPVDLNVWARNRVRFGSDSPFPGAYDERRFPYFRRILEVLGPDHPAREVVLKKSAQLGGTVLAQIFIGGSMDLDPGPTLYVHPTEGNGIRWSKTKWRPFVRNNLPGLFAPATSRDASNSTLYQERKDGQGWLQISGANSEASLSMISVLRQVQDDLSKWEPNNAGDPESQADSRSKAYELAKIFKIGTPLIEDNCKVSRAFKRSTQEHYHVPCPHCGHEHPLEWEAMLAGLDRENLSAAHFTCPSCEGAIREHHRAEILQRGRWVAHNPGASRVGFYLWAAYSPLESFQAIAERWIAAEGDPGKEQAFLNDDVGLAYKSAGEAPPHDKIMERAEAEGHRRGTIPVGGLLLTAGVDVQGDRVEVHLKAFGAEKRRWTIDYRVIPGYVGDAEVREALSALLKETWPDAFGNARPLDLLAIDGNAYTDDVFDWVKLHPQGRVIMVRGAKSDAAPSLAPIKDERRRDGKVKRWSKRFYNVGVSRLKVQLYKALEGTDPLARSFCGFPKGLEEEFYRQLTSERRKPVRNRADGSIFYRWVQATDIRNEVLDTEIYATAAAWRLGWNDKTDEAWALLEAEREQRPAGGRQLDLEDLPLGRAAKVQHPEGDERAASKDAPAASERRASGSISEGLA